MHASDKEASTENSNWCGFEKKIDNWKIVYKQYEANFV